MALVELARFYNVFEASLVKARLDAGDVDSVLFDTEMNWGGLDGVVPVRLMVDDDDFAQARRILADQPITERSGPRS
jgi:hypothetical protein